jgi:hypothetical protein
MEWICFLIAFVFSNAFIHVSALKLPIKRAEIVKRATTGASIKSVSLAGAGNSSALGSVGDIRVINCKTVSSGTDYANKCLVHNNDKGQRSWYDKLFGMRGSALT